MEMERESSGRVEPSWEETLAIYSDWPYLLGGGSNTPKGGIPGRPPFTPSTRPQRFPRVCAASARKPDDRPGVLPGPGPPCPRATGGGLRGRSPRSRGPETVPLAPISPVRNALRPRRLPAAAALGSRPLGSRGRSGERRGQSQHRRGAARDPTPRPVRTPGPSPRS